MSHRQKARVREMRGGGRERGGRERLSERESGGGWGGLGVGVGRGGNVYVTYRKLERD